MIAKNVSESDLIKALEVVNKKYNNNVKFNRFDIISSNRIGFTLKVKDSSGAGAKTGFSGRKTVAACWHIHGDFFEALFDINIDAVVRTANKVITREEGNWQDWNIGSIMEPLYYSEACNC